MPTIPERIYRILLKAYSFRLIYREPMMQLFRDQLRDATGAGKLFHFWARIIGDLLRTVPGSRFQAANLPGGEMRSLEKLAAILAVVVICAGAWLSKHPTSL